MFHFDLTLLAPILFVLFLGILFVYLLLRANKNNSPEDIKREKKVMDEVSDIRWGRRLSAKTNLGKWYLQALIFIFVFPIIARIVDYFVVSPELRINILMILGYLFIIYFIVGIVISNRNRKDIKNK